jgi:ferredoxin
MDLIASAELLSALDRSNVLLDEKRCLHSGWKFSTCDACFDVCPAAAIQPGKPPALDSAKCANCLACLPVCPTGAFAANDAVASLSNTLARLEAKRVELICAKHPHPDSGLPGADAAVQVRGCLAGLGAGSYLMLAALGVEQVTARLDGCSGCEWGSVRPRIEVQIASARRLLAPWGKTDGVDSYSGTPQESPIDPDNTRPVWDADNPPLSRRDFFRMAGRQSQLATARALNQREGKTSSRQPGRDHRRIAATLRHLPELEPAPERPLDGLGFGSLEVSDECSACGVCAHVCPTGALELRREDENQFRLVLSAADCIACGLCVDVCAPAAIQLDVAPDFLYVFSESETVLREGVLTRCESCSAQMAALPGKKYCAPCEFRRKNPMGSAMPPGYRKQR